MVDSINRYFLAIAHRYGYATSGIAVSVSGKMESQPREAPERWDILFQALRDTIAYPTGDHPAARIWAHNDLIRAIRRVQKANVDKLRTTFPAAKEVVNRMLRIGWLTEIAVHRPSVERRSPPRIYLLDMEASPQAIPEPLELLQGYKPRGVLCYYGVLAFHELTTQPPNFLHIGLLQSPKIQGTRETQERSFSESAEQTVQAAPSLGTPEFTLQDQVYYTTRRDRLLIPGIQTREIGPRTQLRMTTLEQTLLDTLLHPFRCGGEAVVFEAWERGINTLNQNRLLKHLEEMDRDDFDRRVGAMFSIMNYALENEALIQRLKNCREKLLRKGDGSIIPILRGFGYSRNLPQWGISAP